MKVRELGRFIRDQRGAARLSLRRLSKLAGISNPYLSQIERGLRRPSAEILQAIAKALRISAETLYVKAGILEERTDSPDLPSLIRRDATISAKEKQVLLDLYQSFQSGDGRRRTPVRKVAAARKSAAARTSAGARQPAAARATKTGSPKGSRSKTRPSTKPKAAPKRSAAKRKKSR